MILSFAAGVFVGVVVGIVISALCHMSAQQDRLQ